MAINYSISYTFSPSTTISSSQVNTNFSDNANTWNGIEAETKTLGKLKMDADPTVALEVATKQYVDHYSTWRRPTLQWASISTVSVESGLDGTSGDIPMLFPDGNLRTETSTTRTTFNITRNCALTGTAQSGLRATLTEANNTWYALYAVKVQDSSTTWVTVGDTTFPTQANFATLNSNLGTSSWVFLGYILNGDGGTLNADIVKFRQVGNFTKFYNKLGAGDISAGVASNGVKIANTASAASLNYSPVSGSAFGSQQTPDTVNVFLMGLWAQGSANPHEIYDSGQNYVLVRQVSSADSEYQVKITKDDGVLLRDSAGTALRFSILIQGFYDTALGVGSNPLL